MQKLTVKMSNIYYYVPDTRQTLYTIQKNLHEADTIYYLFSCTIEKTSLKQIAYLSFHYEK